LNRGGRKEVCDEGVRGLKIARRKTTSEEKELWRKGMKSGVEIVGKADTMDV